jgi:hypothetical protein
MGTLGKILLFVNLLVAVGLAYLAAQDWAKRQDITATAVRYHLTLVGLPVEPPKGVEAEGVALAIPMPGGTVIESVRPKLLDAYFQGADGGQLLGGTAPHSQIDEVKRVQAKVMAQLQGENDAGRLARLCGVYTPKGYNPGWLSLLAESYDERELVHQLAKSKDVKDAADKAQAMLRRRFDAVLAAPNPRLANDESAKIKEASETLRKANDAARMAFTQFQAFKDPNDPNFKAAKKQYEDTLNALVAARDALAVALGVPPPNVGSAVRAADRLTGEAAPPTATRDESDRRHRVAHLLAVFDPAAAWQKRVALVTGLRVYHESIAAQVNRLREMAAAVQQQMVLDQAAFSEEYEMLKGMAVERDLLLRQQQALTADLELQRSKDLEAVKQRQAQLVRRQEDLAAISGQIAQTLAKQAQVEQQLFAVQKQVGQTLDQNLQLEKKLDAAEERKTEQKVGAAK